MKLKEQIFIDYVRQQKEAARNFLNKDKDYRVADKFKAKGALDESTNLLKILSVAFKEEVTVNELEEYIKEVEENDMISEAATKEKAVDQYLMRRWTKYLEVLKKDKTEQYITERYKAIGAAAQIKRFEEVITIAFAEGMTAEKLKAYINTKKA